MKNIWQVVKTKMKSLATKIELERFNIKVDLSFWVFLPYKETINYVINNKTYKPTSYRFLCFAVIVVTSGHEVDYKFSEDLKKVFNKKNV